MTPPNLDIAELRALPAPSGHVFQLIPAEVAFKARRVLVVSDAVSVNVRGVLRDVVEVVDVDPAVAVNINRAQAPGVAINDEHERPGSGRKAWARDGALINTTISSLDVLDHQCVCLSARDDRSRR